MTLDSNPPRTACPHIRRNPAAPVVVALLSVFAALSAPADTQVSALAPIANLAPTVDSVVSKVSGPVLDLLDGALQIDVTNAKIIGRDDRFMSPVPWAGILPGSRVIAQVIVPDVTPRSFRRGSRRRTSSSSSRTRAASPESSRASARRRARSRCSTRA